MSVKVAIRDIPVQIPINVHDFCNCLSSCFNRPTKVYITKNMVAEKFNPSRSVDSEADRKVSFQRIHWLFNKYDSECMIEASILFQDRGEYLTTRDIQQINEMLCEATTGSEATQEASE